MRFITAKDLLEKDEEQDQPTKSEEKKKSFEESFFSFLPASPSSFSKLFNVI